MKKLLLISIVSLFMLSACNKVFYQVYTAKAPGLVEKENVLVYENEDCEVMYNLWAEEGNFGFVIKNKTDKNLFVILPQTFFIKNGEAFDYYKNREYKTVDVNVKTAGVSSGTTILGNGSRWPAWYNGVLNVFNTLNVNQNKIKGVSRTSVTKEKPVICIPPGSYKEISEYSISGQLIRNCDRKQAYPKRKSNAITYSRDDSPIVFKNRIAYSFYANNKDTKYIENEFWVSELINYSKKEAIKEKELQGCDGDEIVKIKIFKISSPNKFYNSYIFSNK